MSATPNPFNRRAVQREKERAHDDAGSQVHGKKPKRRKGWNRRPIPNIREPYKQNSDDELARTLVHGRSGIPTRSPNSAGLPRRVTKPTSKWSRARSGSHAAERAPRARKAYTSSVRCLSYSTARDEEGGPKIYGEHVGRPTKRVSKPHAA